MPTSTAPSESAAGSPAAGTKATTKARLALWPAPSWLVHDVILYAGSYLTLLLADMPAGGGWDALIAAAPVAASQLVRQTVGKW